jgi:hypothetical protein
MPKKYHLSSGIYNFVISVIEFLNAKAIYAEKTIIYEISGPDQKMTLG